MSRLQKPIIMKEITFVLVYNRRGAKGLAPVEIRVYQGGSNPKYYQTGVQIERKFWNVKKRMVVGHPAAVAYNLRLSKLKTELLELQTRMIIENYGNHVSLAEFDHRYKFNGGVSFINFTEFYQIELNQANLAPATKQTQTNTLKTLIGYAQKVHFSDLTFAFLDGFDKYLIKKGVGVTTREKYHRHLKKYVNLAIKKGYMSERNNPYLKYKPQKGYHKPKEFLLLEEVKRIEDLSFHFTEVDLEIARDVFLMMCYTGLRIQDALRLTERHFSRSGIKWSLKIEMQKVGKTITLPLYALFRFKGEPESRANRLASRCIESYKNAQELPLFWGGDNDVKHKKNRFNRLIKQISKRAGIEKHLSSHCGRHTFGTNLATKIPINLLKDYMGHSKIKTTMIYAHVSKEIEDKVMEQIEW